MTGTLHRRELTIGSMPAAYFGAGQVGRLGEVVRGAGGQAVVVITDAALAATPVIPVALAALADRGLAASLFTGVRPNPTVGDIAAGAEAVSAAADGAGPVVLAAVGGGSAIDAAKGIALAAVNPQRGRQLDYRSQFATRALPIVAVPTTAGTGAETNAFGVVTDEVQQRKFYVGHASTVPAAAILDPELTVGLPPAATAATGMDALTHALESYLSVRPNPWAAGLALQAARMIAEYLPRACADGADREARAQMLLAAHMAGLAMASTGLGACHAIGHSLGTRFGIAHGAALTLVLPEVLEFCRKVAEDRLAELSFALGTGVTGAPASRNATAAIDAVARLADTVGLSGRLADHGIAATDFGQVAADALDDDVLANAPLQPRATDITAILAAAGARAGRGAADGG